MSVSLQLPPDIWQQPRRERLVKPLATIGGLSLLTLALRLRDPHHHASWGLCPSAALGIYCPGCGGLRAVNDLTHGQVGAAFSSNPLFVVLLPVLVAGLVVWTIDRWQGRRRELSPAARRTTLVLSVVVLVAYTVLRNLPGSWMAP